MNFILCLSLSSLFALSAKTPSVCGVFKLILCNPQHKGSWSSWVVLFWGGWGFLIFYNFFQEHFFHSVSQYKLYLGKKKTKATTTTKKNGQKKLG